MCSRQELYCFLIWGRFRRASFASDNLCAGPVIFDGCCTEEPGGSGDREFIIRAYDIAQEPEERCTAVWRDANPELET